MRKEIASREILDTALRAARSARRSIRMTMDAVEELENPLPSEYFSLLREKMDEGVNVTRICFGSDADVDRLGDRVHFSHPNYTLVRAQIGNYKRMLLVDETMLMFAERTADGRHVYYSNEADDIARSVGYLTAFLR